MPWISSKIGGYHLFPSHLIRETQFTVKQDTKEILPILDSLNALQATPAGLRLYERMGFHAETVRYVKALPPSSA